MTSHHAIEIRLTRPATSGELYRARRAVRLAANADRTRLMAVHPAKTSGRALRLLRRRHHLLPIDVLTTHYPDQYGHVLLNLSLSRTARAAIRQAAAASGQRPGDFVGRSVTATLERNERERSRHLTVQLEGLFAFHTFEDVLACTAHVLLRRRSPAVSDLYAVDRARRSHSHPTP